jgi:hypothetical protein
MNDERLRQMPQTVTLHAWRASSRELRSSRRDKGWSTPLQSLIAFLITAPAIILEIGLDITDVAPRGTSSRRRHVSKQQQERG